MVSGSADPVLIGVCRMARLDHAELKANRELMYVVTEDLSVVSFAENW
jgi:hypothetical protein